MRSASTHVAHGSCGAAMSTDQEPFGSEDTWHCVLLKCTITHAASTHRQLLHAVHWADKGDSYLVCAGVESLSLLGENRA